MNHYLYQYVCIVTSSSSSSGFIPDLIRVAGANLSSPLQPLLCISWLNTLLSHVFLHAVLPSDPWSSSPSCSNSQIPHFLSTYWSSLLQTYPNHRSLPSRNLTLRSPTAMALLTPSFCTLSNRVTPLHHCSIFISVTSNFFSSHFVRATVSRPYSIAGLPMVLCIFPFTFG